MPMFKIISMFIGVTGAMVNLILALKNKEEDIYKSAWYLIGMLSSVALIGCVIFF